MTASRFRKSVTEFGDRFGRVSAGEERLLGAVKELEGRLHELTAAKSAPDMSAQHDVAKLAHQLKSTVRDTIRHWTRRFAEAAPVRQLSEKYEDRAILLVFGKVNSGKSTFVNLLVDELQRTEAKVRGFAIEGGNEIDVDPVFAVGATETTARIQGVEVDDGLVFLDSPGLHSVTGKNHELTKLFTDGADAVLWLSSSNSPGQVHEVRDLKEELNRRKPLLPLITKSDWLDEDWCETSEQMIAEVRNKRPEVRIAQEEDVVSRTRQEVARTRQPESEVQVRPPISISVLAYETAGRSNDARNEAGVSRLYECLVELVEEASRYKVRKAERQARNYIDKEVMGRITENVEPGLDDLIARSERCIRELDGAKRQQIKDDVDTAASSQLRRIVDRHRDARDKRGIAHELGAAVAEKLGDALNSELRRYVDQVATALVPMLVLSPEDMEDFGDITMDFERKKGAAARSVAASVGGVGTALGGAALGTALFPGIGTVIGAIGGVVGGIVGGVAGSGIGSLFEDTEVVSEKIGVSSEPVEESAGRVAKFAIEKQVDAAIDAVIEIIRTNTAFSGTIRIEIDRFKKQVGEIASQ